MEYHVIWDDWEDGIERTEIVEAENIGSSYCKAIEQIGNYAMKFSEGDIQSISYSENGKDRFVDKLVLIEDLEARAQMDEYDRINKKPDLIREAKPGSLLHRINEKIAYKVHEICPRNSADSNWFTAERFLKIWERCLYENKKKFLLKTIEDELKSLEDFYRNKELKYEDIKYEFACSIVDFYKKFII